MVYMINGKIVTVEEFETELQKRIDDYIPYSEYYPKKEDIRKVLAENREFTFFKYDKRCNFLRIVGEDSFVAVEEEISDIVDIVVENQCDPLDNDALRIAIALYENGYRKINGD